MELKRVGHDRVTSLLLHFFCSSCSKIYTHSFRKEEYAHLGSPPLVLLTFLFFLLHDLRPSAGSICGTHFVYYALILSLFSLSINMMSCTFHIYEVHKIICYSNDLFLPYLHFYVFPFVLYHYLNRV